MCSERLRKQLRLWLLRLPALAVLAAASTSLAQEAYDPHAVLVSVRNRLLPELERLPRYTCVQTIMRRYFRPEPHGPRPSCTELIAAQQERRHELPLMGWDRLRLEVAIVDGENVFSWVGAPKFEAGTFEKLSAGGPMGSGDFGPFLNSILGVATVSFQKEQTVDGKRLLLYSYQMPLSRSHYEIKADKGWMLTGYSGTFLLDPLAPDIVTLSVHTDELPDNKQVCQAISEVEYGRISIHDRPILLPRETSLRMIDPRGSDTLSNTTYSDCREYTSKSTIFFDVPPEGTVKSGARDSTAPPKSLPPGLRLLGRIVTPVDSDTAAAGDPIDVVLRKPLRYGNNVVIAPAGTPLHARLTRVQQWVGNYTQIAFQFETIEINGVKVPLRAQADFSPVGPSRVPGSTVVSQSSASRDITTINIRGERAHFRQFDWGWTTLPIDPKDDQPF